MLELNCDDILDVMKRLREHRAVIIRHRAWQGEEESTGEGECGWGGGKKKQKKTHEQEKVQHNKRQEGEKTDSKCWVLHTERLLELQQGKEHFSTNHGPEEKAALANAGTHAEYTRVPFWVKQTW